MTNQLIDEQHINDESQWLSALDLMSGLMITFMFISVIFMRHTMIEREKIKSIADTYLQNKNKIYESLKKEFKTDLDKWDAEIDKKDLSFRFKSPDALFDKGKIELKYNFKEIINDFFPRYIKIIYEFRGSIKEVRIEGHTSSVWMSSSIDDAYFLNMNLSQGRTRSVLSYIYYLDSTDKYKKWIKNNFSAVGYSSSKPILKNNIEDLEKSRRVVFKVITNSENHILKIIGS